MKKNDKILIHAGSGGIGQAAINLCLFYGCEIFTTVGNADKKKFITKTFPQVFEISEECNTIELKSFV